MKTLLSEQVKVFITDKITVMKGGEVLLRTINNIHSYHKLMDTLGIDMKVCTIKVNSIVLKHHMKQH